MAQKILQGVVTIDAVGDWDLVLPANPSGLQNALSNKVLEDVYVIIENFEFNLGDYLNINLPKISTFNNAWNPKIHILSKLDFVQIKAPLFINSYYDAETPRNSDSINQLGQVAVAIQPYSIFQVVSNNYWAYLYAAPEIIGEGVIHNPLTPAQNQG